MTRRAEPGREGLPLSHYAARRTCRHIVRNGTTVHLYPGQTVENVLTLLEVQPGVAILTPAYNGNWHHDREAFHSVLSDATIVSMLMVAKAGGDELPTCSIREICKAHGGNVEALLAYFGHLTDSRGRAAHYDDAVVIPVDLTNGEQVAAFRFMQAHFPGSRVIGNVYKQAPRGRR